MFTDAETVLAIPIRRPGSTWREELLGIIAALANQDRRTTLEQEELVTDPLVISETIGITLFPRNISLTRMMSGIGMGT